MFESRQYLSWPSAPARLLVVAVAATSLAGCASSGAGSGSTASGAAATPTQPPASSRYVLTRADLDLAKADNLYDVVRTLRPEFLRGGTTNHTMVPGLVCSKDPGCTDESVGGTDAVMVYRDNVRLTGVDDLRQIQVGSVKEVRFLPAKDAIVRFGTNHSGGAILITSR